METQWHKLRQSLANAGTDGTTNQFFRRLLVVLSDPGSGPSDKIKAYYDALASAHTHRIGSPSLPLRGHELHNKLEGAGLVLNHLTGEIQLNEKELVTLETDVYSEKKRRFLEKPVMDVALATRLQDEGFTHYNGHGQQTAIRVALTSPDDSTLFVNLPTGCGKTLLIHALMLMTPSHRLTLVVVPTVALAIEQGVRATEILNSAGQHHGGPYEWVSGQSKEVRTQLRKRLKRGAQRILFCSPEAVRTSLLPLLFQLAKHDQLGALIVDEAHLVDQWGVGFRPNFQLVAPLVQSLQGVAPRGIRKILMSATFSPATMETLKNIFASPGKEPIEVHANFLRPEPSYYLTRAKFVDEHQRLVLTQLRRMPRPLIFYVTTKDDSRRWYNLLLELGYKRVGLFHGDTGISQREQLITKWRENQIDIMVATSAFGVGMDKSDIRSVLHASVPENIDRYYQECGRGGRDGHASIAHLIYHKGQIVTAKRLNQEKLVSTKLGHERWIYMLQGKEAKGEGRFKIDLTTQHREIKYDGPRNMAWNWRTLLLMKRAGFIRLFFSEPQLPQDEVLDEEHLSKFYADYFSHVEVEITHDGHLNQDIWDEVIGRQRTQESEDRSTGFTQLKEWLDHPTTKLCELLGNFYITNGYSPEGACGGCPGCRTQSQGPFSPTLGSMVQPVIGWNPGNSNSMGEEQRVHYKGIGLQPRTLLHRWKHLIAILLQKDMIRAIRAQPEVHKMLVSVLSGNNFWCALTKDEPNSLWGELVLVMPDETEFPRSAFNRNRKILLIPDHLPDFSHSQRLWTDCDQQAISIEDFERRLSYVYN